MNITIIPYVLNKANETEQFELSFTLQCSLQIHIAMDLSEASEQRILHRKIKGKSLLQVLKSTH